MVTVGGTVEAVVEAVVVGVTWNGSWGQWEEERHGGTLLDRDAKCRI